MRGFEGPITYPPAGSRKQKNSDALPAISMSMRSPARFRIDATGMSTSSSYPVNTSMKAHQAWDQPIGPANQVLESPDRPEEALPMPENARADEEAVQGLPETAVIDLTNPCTAQAWTEFLRFCMCALGAYVGTYTRAGFSLLRVWQVFSLHPVETDWMIRYPLFYRFVASFTSYSQ